MALSCQNRYEQAVEAYKRALELEPNQESYKNNLKIAEDKVRELNQARGDGAPNPFASLFGGAAPGAAPGGMPDFASMLSSPQMMQMAQSLMTDPNIQNMMGQMMSTEGGGFGNFIQMGQQVRETAFLLGALVAFLWKPT